MSEPKLLTEVVPGIEHWSAPHPNHGQTVHSHYLTEQRASARRSTRSPPTA
jgi:hypothetical protein